MIGHRVVSGMDEDDEDEDMDDGGDDSFGEDDDMIGVSDVTNQLAAAGWQHGVKFCFVNTLLLLPTNTQIFMCGCQLMLLCFYHANTTYATAFWQPSIAIAFLKSSQMSHICKKKLFGSVF